MEGLIDGVYDGDEVVGTLLGAMVEGVTDGFSEG